MKGAAVMPFTKEPYLEHVGPRRMWEPSSLALKIKRLFISPVPILFYLLMLLFLQWEHRVHFVLRFWYQKDSRSAGMEGCLLWSDPEAYWRRLVGSPNGTLSPHLSIRWTIITRDHQYSKWMVWAPHARLKIRSELSPHSGGGKLGKQI